MSDKKSRTRASVNSRPHTVTHTSVSFQPQSQQQQQHPSHSPHHHHRDHHYAHQRTSLGTALAARSEYSESTLQKSSPHNFRLENTYRMSPDEDCRFLPSKVETLMKEQLQRQLKGVTYDSGHCSKLSQDLCAAIKAKTKELGFKRYKLIATVVIGQDSEQSVEVASRCLWNPSTDNFATATFRNDSIYAIATMYGIYLD